MIPPFVIDQILRLDAADVLAKYITIKKRGSNYQACCPFHNEKSPSFSINPRSNRFKCFGCGKSGNVIDFVMVHPDKEYMNTLILIYHLDKFQFSILKHFIFCNFALNKQK